MTASTDNVAAGRLPTRRLPLAMAILVPLLVCGCRDSESGTTPPRSSRGPDPRHGFVAFVGAGRNDPLWPILEAGGRRHLERTSTIEMRFFCPDSATAQAQLHLLDSLQDPDLRGICIQLRDPAALTHKLESLSTRGLPIVSMVMPAAQRMAAAHSGLDNPAIGRALAEQTALEVGENGSVMLIHAGDEDPAYASRRREFERAMRDHPGIDVLAQLDCRGDPREARSLIREWSHRYPRVSAWIAVDDWPLQDYADPETALPAGVRLITFGGTPEQWPLIRRGTCPRIVTADYHEMGSMAAQFCDTAVRDPGMPRQQYLAPLRTLSANNLDEYIREWTEWSATRPAGERTGE